ncbi:MAG: hypothetical protein NT077_00860 [Candidatus Taylorbacteria bacterium]|nr:hypothetical protein [Candidatus Taylorbacteria bacterium]
MKTKTNLIAAALFVFIMLPSISQAQQTYTALEPLPCIEGGGITCTAAEKIAGKTTFNFENYVQYIFNLVIFLAAASAVFMIVFGGLQYMTTEAWTGKGAALEKVKNAIYGLLLVLGSYLILRTIDPRLVAIPNTLVAPLNIDYSKYDSIASLFNTLDKLGNQLDKLAERNKQILRDVTVAREQVAGLEADKVKKCEELRSSLNDQNFYVEDSSSCDNLLKQATEAGFSQDLVRQVASLNDQINTQKIQIATKVGVGTMTDEILSCAAGTSFDTCRNRILGFRTKYANQLGDLSNDPALKANLDDYARYAAVMAYVNSQVSLAVDATTLTAVQAGIQAAGVGAITLAATGAGAVTGAVGGAVTVGAGGAVAGSAVHLVGTTAGAVVGGVVGGVAGGVAGAGTGGVVGNIYANDLLRRLNNARATPYVAEAINNIKNYTKPTIASIINPQLKFETQAQVDAIVAGLTPKK